MDRVRRRQRTTNTERRPASRRTCPGAPPSSGPRPGRASGASPLAPAGRSARAVWGWPSPPAAPCKRCACVGGGWVPLELSHSADRVSVECKLAAQGRAGQPKATHRFCAMASCTVASSPRMRSPSPKWHSFACGTRFVRALRVSGDEDKAPGQSRAEQSLPASGRGRSAQHTCCARCAISEPIHKLTHNRHRPAHVTQQVSSAMLSARLPERPPPHLVAAVDEVLGVPCAAHLSVEGDVVSQPRRELACAAARDPDTGERPSREAACTFLMHRRAPSAGFVQSNSAECVRCCSSRLLSCSGTLACCGVLPSTAAAAASRSAAPAASRKREASSGAFRNWRC